MGQDYDVVVIGLGCVGISTCLELVRQDLDVLGIDQFEAPNESGSSHGSSRIIRLAYPEGGEYIPMLRRSYQKWFDLEESCGRDMYHRTHSLTIGPPDSDKIESAKEACDSNDVAYDVLTGQEASEKFEAWSIPDELIALHQMNGGVLDVNACLEGQLELAEDNGLDVIQNEEVIDWEDGDETFIETEDDKIYTDNIVVCSGPWAAESDTKISDLLEVERHVICEFEPENPDQYNLDSLPVWMMDTGERDFYGLPMYSSGVKVGDVTAGSNIESMDDFQYECSNIESATARGFCEEYFTDEHMVLDSVRACPLTHTEDGGFIIDSYSEYENVYAGVGMSGHGFKLSPAVGEILAGKVVDEEVEYETPDFSINRFQ